MIKLILGVLLSVSANASEAYLDFITTGVEPGYTMLVYTKANGEVCRLKMKEVEVKSNTEKIKWWIDYVNNIQCNVPEIKRETPTNRMDLLR